MRWVHYGRYSTDMQSAASIEDQFRVCRARCDRDGWTLVEAHEDRAMSGTSRLQPGYQRLLIDARQGKFDVVAEALDLLSRDLEDIAQLFYEHLTFSGVRLFTLSEVGSARSISASAAPLARSMAEVLVARPKDIRQKYETELVGMTEEVVSLDDLIEARTALVRTIVSEMPADHRRFLVSFERGKPDWDLLGIPKVDKLPAIQRRLHNLDKITKNKRAEIGGST